LLAATEEGAYKPFDVIRCAIEPSGHAPIYQKVQENLEKPSARPLTEALSYVIIKGSYTEYTLIFNVREITPDVVRTANTLSKSLTHSFKEIIGVFLYEDISSARHYLVRATRQRRQAMRKVYGNAEIYQRIRE